LSVEAPHEKVAVVSLMAINVRLVGAVGADRSPLPAELTEALKSSTATNASAAPPTMSEKRRVVMMDPPLDETVSGNRHKEFMWLSMDTLVHHILGVN
jgi:hypothetical protein